MNQISFGVAIFAAMLLNEPDQLTGRWQSPPSPSGSVTSISFKADKSFEGFVNRKPFTTGKYVLEDSIFSFTDNGCNNLRGVYKLAFSPNKDTIRFIPITDSCTERKMGMSKLMLSRVKL